MTLLKYAHCEPLDNIWSLLDHPMMKRAASNNSATLITPADVVEKEDAYFVYMDLPGFSKENIDIAYHENKLTIQGNRETFSESDENKLHSIERRGGSFCRRFSFPESVDSEKITAKYDNGVLEVCAPKQAVVKPQRIVVE